MIVDPMVSQGRSRKAHTAQTFVSCETANGTTIVNINPQLATGLTNYEK